MAIFTFAYIAEYWTPIHEEAALEAKAVLAAA
jgi:hypothetical protein